MSIYQEVQKWSDLYLLMLQCTLILSKENCTTERGKCLDFWIMCAALNLKKSEWALSPLDATFLNVINHKSCDQSNTFRAIFIMNLPYAIQAFSYSTSAASQWKQMKCVSGSFWFTCILSSSHFLISEFSGIICKKDLCYVKNI